MPCPPSDGWGKTHSDVEVTFEKLFTEWKAIHISPKIPLCTQLCWHVTRPGIFSLDPTWARTGFELGSFLGRSMSKPIDNALFVAVIVHTMFTRCRRRKTTFFVKFHHTPYRNSPRIPTRRRRKSGTLGCLKFLEGNGRISSSPRTGCLNTS